MWKCKAGGARLQMRFCLLIVSPEISCSLLALEMQGRVSMCVLQEEREYIFIDLHAYNYQIVANNQSGEVVQ